MPMESVYYIFLLYFFPFLLLPVGSIPLSVPSAPGGVLKYWHGWPYSRGGGYAVSRTHRYSPYVYYLVSARSSRPIYLPITYINPVAMTRTSVVHSEVPA